MNKKKKGFTLVELLAVIVILGVIGLIATPIVNDYVKEAKEERIINSLNNIERAAITYFTSENTRNSTVVDLKSGLIELDNNDINKGIAIGNRDSVKIYIYKNGYCGIKDGDNITVKKMEEGACNFNVDSNIEFITNNKIPKDKKILGYRIYGNTVNNNSLGENNTIVLKLKGNNLFNIQKSGLSSGTSTIETYNNGYRLIAKEGQTSNVMATLSNYQFDLDNGNYTICAEAQFEGEFLKADGTVADKINPLISILNTETVNGNKYQYNSGTPKNGDKYFMYINFQVTDTNKVGFLRILFNNLNAIRTWNTQGIIWNIQILSGTIKSLDETSYEPYLEPKEYTINLSSPLRKYGNKVDYIDSTINQIVRNVGIKADGTLYELETPTYEYIKLPSIANLDGTTNISVSDGNISSSKIEVIIAK